LYFHFRIIDKKSLERGAGGSNAGKKKMKKSSHQPKTFGQLTKVYQAPLFRHKHREI